MGIFVQRKVCLGYSLILPRFTEFSRGCSIPRQQGNHSHCPYNNVPHCIFMYLLLHFGQWFRDWDGDLSKCFRCEPPVNIEVLGDSHLNKRTTVRVKGQRRAWEIVYLCGINRFKVIKWNKIIYICCHCLRGQCGLKLSLLSPIRLSTYVTVCEDSALFFVMLLNQIELT